MDKIQGKIKFIAPSLQDEHYSTAYILGNITSVSYTHLASMTTTQKTYLHIIQELENKDVDLVMRSIAGLS